MAVAAHPTRAGYAVVTWERSLLSLEAGILVVQMEAGEAEHPALDQESTVVQ
jgi:hypothetical protein